MRPALNSRAPNYPDTRVDLIQYQPVCLSYNGLLFSDDVMTSTHSAPEPKIDIVQFRDLLERLHPFAAVLGIDVVHIGHDNACLRLPERNAHQRMGGMVAGPMLMGLADLALYAAVVGATGNPDAVTSSLTINFLRKAPPGDILAHARIHKTGRTCAGDVLLEPANGGPAVAQVISTWSLPRAK